MMEEDAEASKGIKVVVPLFETEEPCGKVFVERPETTGNAMSRYTTYLVRGVLGASDSFSSRKRYSDFEWLRKALTTHFPGVPVPKIPPKQTTGRFEEAFVEERRAGLEVFLQRCLRRRQIAQGSPLLQAFLQASEAAMEELRKEYDRRSIAEKCREFKVAFARELGSLEVAADEARLAECKNFLDGQVKRLRDLTEAFADSAKAQRAARQAAVTTQRKLEAVCCEESGMLADAHVSEQPRVELLAAFRQQSESLEDAPALHYDVLQAAAERELDDTEAMQEAVKELDQMGGALADLKKKVETVEATKKSLEEGGSAPSGLMSMFGRQDKETQLTLLRADLDKANEDAVAVEEWFAAARTVALGQEMATFLSSNALVHRWSKDIFAQRSQSTSERLASLWGALARPAIAAPGI